ncbi:NAD dependent epimerase/dehydratase family protein [Streptosporangium subroseum]|uniref:NAD dependent epimerase/dehydratase family protein n=1 Tax=Streptosporangium subroseum TaxID=106412 RepID=A0A239AEZ6_9ACTN|nr:NAD(P)-dependent oxidoreductase [Streptosporangium subroseum]SNR94130.1 NAD dependent epimerase/dehydratase family protein [Streptosporangium subroseum]
MATVLITGAAGRVAGQLRPGLEGLDLRVTDRRDVQGWDGAEVVVGDLSDPAFAAKAVDGVDAVVHLAASPNPSAPWADLRSPNVDTVATVLDAALAAGVAKVVLATSVHVMGGYVRPGGAVVDPSWPARPCCRYGATKAFAEAYGSVVAASGGTSVVCLRLGLCRQTPTTTSNIAEWLAPADLQRLVRAALAAEVRYGAYFGVSANTRRLFDLSNARADLGYEPLFDSEVFADEVRPGPAGLCTVTHSAPPPV